MAKRTMGDRVSQLASELGRRLLPWAFGDAPHRRRDALGSGAADSDADPFEWARVKALFTAALERPAEERQDFLDQIGNEDRVLAARLRALVESHEAMGPLDALQNRVMGPLTDQLRSSADLVGETVHHYEILEKLDKGGMGVVYRACDTRLDRTVALKFLSTHLLSDAAAKERFVVEARAAATLDHPNLCTIHEVGETEDGHLFIAMAFYPGQTLKQRIARGPLSTPEALDVAAQVGRGLACAAEKGIVHRDIKPGNLILTVEGTVKIVDFGLAKVVGEQLTKSGARMGTVAYMSPEQARGEAVDQRSDIWSLGVVLYEMLAGKRPFQGGADMALIHAILNEAPAALDELVPGIGSGVSALVERALMKDPAQRYGDAAHLLRDVERLLADPESQRTAAPALALLPEGERRLITVLACAISGYEGLLDTLAPDEADRELARLRNRLRGLVEDYGGVLNSFSEEQAVALFGVPLTHEDDALRAVRAGLEVQRDLVRGSLGEGLALGAAVASGHVAIRPTDAVAHPFRVGGTVIRDVSLLAAAAATGELLISPDLSRSLAPLLVTGERQPVALASGQRPIHPLAVLGESETDSIMDASTPGSLSRFVGREAEMETLLRGLAGSTSGSGRLISIVGEAGLGKSRILHEFRSVLAEEGIRYVQGRCQSYGSLTPFVPLVESVRTLLGLGRSTPEQAHDIVVKRIRALAPELEIYLPILLHMLSIDSDAFPLPDYLTDDEFRSASAEALASVFTLGAKAQPLVILLEDWHWSDGGSSEVLQALGEMASAHALLIVVTSRPQAEQASAAGAATTRLELAPLDGPSATRLVRSALRDVRVSGDLAEELCQKAGGNPFFIEELCHALLESGIVHIENGEARVAGSLHGLDVPNTVQAVLRGRLDRLDPEAREVLRCASVIGRRFGLRLLSQIVPSPSRLEGSLDSLRALGFIQRTSMVPELVYRFNHALTLDVTYDSLLERQRKERHGVVGAAIEAVHNDQLDDYLDRLAGHFAIAEVWDKAIHYGFAAADRSAGLWQYKDAVATLERTRGCIQSSACPEDERRRRLVPLLLDQERHLERIGDRDRQQSVIEDLLTLVPDIPSPERATALVRQGEFYTLTERYEEAETCLLAAVTAAEECGADHERSLALRGLGLRYWRMGQYEAALKPVARLVGYSRENGSPTVLIRDLLNLGRVYRELERWDDAWAVVREAESLEPRANPLDLGYVNNFRAHLLRALGRPDEALQAFRAADEVHCNSGLGRLVPIRVSIHLLSTAALHLEMGLIDEALAMYDESTALARQANRADNLAHSLSLHGDALITLGRPAQAYPLFEEAAGVLLRLGSHRLHAETTGKLAAALEASDMPEAAETWERVRHLRLELGDRAGALTATEHRVRLADPAEDDTAALLSEALELATELEDAAAIARVRNQLALHAWRQKDLSTASEHFDQAAQCLREHGEEDGLGIILNGWGAVLSSTGRNEEAIRVLEEALGANQRSGDVNREADTWSALGACLRATGETFEAHNAYEHCLKRRRAAQDRAGAGWALGRLAGLARDSDRPDVAQALASEAVSIARETEDVDLMALCESIVDHVDRPSSA